MSHGFEAGVIPSSCDGNQSGIRRRRTAARGRRGASPILFENGKMSVMDQGTQPSVDARTRKLVEAPLLRTLLEMAAPNALVMVTQTGVGSLEVYFLAKLGVDTLAGD
jgi:hypothetical protein